MFFKEVTYFHVKISTCVLLIIAVTNVIVYGQRSPAQIVTVQGEVLKPLKLSRDEIMNLKQTEVSARDHDGELRTYKGVALVDVLIAAGVTLGAQLRGKNLMKYVAVKAADSYEVVFSLPEIDPEFTSQTILLAYKVDGADLANEDGPYRMVVPNERKHARWVREVISIRVVAAKE